MLNPRGTIIELESAAERGTITVQCAASAVHCLRSWLAIMEAHEAGAVTAADGRKVYASIHGARLNAMLLDPPPPSGKGSDV